MNNKISEQWEWEQLKMDLWFTLVDIIGALPRPPLIPLPG